MCIFKCEFCKPNQQHECRKCGAKDSHFTRDCTSGKKTCKTCGKYSYYNDECTMCKEIRLRGM
jgi:hypothetical protein